jgi:endoglucanase
MDRRDFLRVTGTISAISVTGFNLVSCDHTPNTAMADYAKYRGFNLLAKFSGQGPRRKFDEEDFEIMAEWGFDFARIPMSYWNWSSKDNWFDIDEEIFEDIDEAIELGRRYNIHINLNMHRVPGYCINGRELEPCDLFEDSPENMKRALDAAVFHWQKFAERYRGIPNAQLSFDLINEPPHMRDEKRYIEVITELVNGILEKDPGRLIVADGKDVGRTPVYGIIDLGLVQSTRGYDPMSVSHYKATWVPKAAFQTFKIPTWPLTGDDGKIWDKTALKTLLIDTWKPLVDRGVQVHVGEWGCYNKTPHHVALKWMRDMLSLWKEVGWGHAMWNLKGDFGPLNSSRTDVKYEKFRGHQLDREMLELLKEFM